MHPIHKRFLLLPLILLFFCCTLTGCGGSVAPFQDKADLLASAVLTADTERALGNRPAKAAGHVVFFSVCDTGTRASVYTGTGETLTAAWEAARQVTETALQKYGVEPVWVKVDVVSRAEEITLTQLSEAVLAARSEFYRVGVSLDPTFETALLEAELNGAKIYEYDNGGIDLSYLNTYLQKAGRHTVEALPERVTVFQTVGWFCDENGTIYPLSTGQYDTGRRQMDFVDKETAETLILQASDFLLRQVKEDGSFVYGYYPRFDNEIENYNIVRHASTLWSLLCRYRIQPDAELKEAIDKTIGYMLTQIRYDGEVAYLYEEKDDEIKLGGCGVAVVALTEYMDVFGVDTYRDICEALGEGILTLMNPADGTYVHVLHGDFTIKEDFRTVYYDGEATFALSRLYGLTKEEKWLDAACLAVDHFIRADYTQYKDHWIAYTMNELTKYVTDRTDYYIFALENAQGNMETIRDRDTTYHTYLELLMATFEVYDRLISSGADLGGFRVEDFLETIHTRTVQMLNGFFFPEYAMYMENPSRILHTFMVRHDGYRVRIDDVQHNIGGYYLYYKNYEKLIAYGLADLASGS